MGRGGRRRRPTCPLFAGAGSSDSGRAGHRACQDLGGAAIRPTQEVGVDAEGGGAAVAEAARRAAPRNTSGSSGTGWHPLRGPARGGSGMVWAMGRRWALASSRSEGGGCEPPSCERHDRSAQKIIGDSRKVGYQQVPGRPCLSGAIGSGAHRRWPPRTLLAQVLDVQAPALLMRRRECRSRYTSAKDASGLLPQLRAA